MRIYNQDNREALKELPDNSVDSVVTDPPYGLSFMNKKWDYDVPSVEFWREVYRVLKPGGHILSFGGTRTYHRMVVNIEDAGFEIRDQIQWIYSTGFPKSLNIGKAVDKIEGNEREIVGTLENYQNKSSAGANSHMMEQVKPRIDLPITKGSSEYEGWGTGLKPANEPIVLARKPLSEKSISENVMRWRTGGLNIDGCRIGFNEDDSYTKLKGGVVEGKEAGQYGNYDQRAEGSTAESPIGYKQKIMVKNDTGRFPANVILECICDEVIQGESHVKMRNKPNGVDICRDATSYKIGSGVVNRDYKGKGDIHTNPDCPCYIMDEQSGVSKSTEMRTGLKPANEPIVLARKPLSEKSISENVLRWRTGGLNIDGCRIGFNEDDSYTKLKGGVVEGKEAGQMYHRHEKGMEGNNYKQKIMVKNDTGRFPANVILECCCDEVIQGEKAERTTKKTNINNKEANWFRNAGGDKEDRLSFNDKGDIHTNPDCPCYIMDEESGVSKSTKMRTGDRDSSLNSNDVFGIKNDGKTKRIENFGDGGGASRFFYRAKVSKKERNLGLDDKTNQHPTVKPINLLTYLCRLITPERGIILDPFMGSGSTGVAALLEGFDFIGIELEKDYYNIAKRRIEKYEEYKKIIK